MAYLVSKLLANDKVKLQRKQYSAANPQLNTPIYSFN